MCSKSGIYFKMKYSNNNTSNRNGILLMIIGIFIVSIEDAGLKYLVETNYHPFQIMCLSAWFVCFVLLCISMVKNRSVTKVALIYKTEYWQRHMIRALLSVVTGIFFLFSLKFLKLVDVTIIFFLSPIIMTAMSAIFLKEHVGTIRWLAVIIGFLGVVIAFQPSIGKFNWHYMLPLAGSFSYSVRAVLIRTMSGIESATQIVFYTRLGVAVLSTIPMILLWNPMSIVDIFLISGLSFLLLIAHLLITKSTITAPLSIVGPFEYTALIWTSLLGYFIWGDLPSVMMTTGATLIVGAGLLIAWREIGYRRKYVGS